MSKVKENLTVKFGKGSLDVGAFSEHYNKKIILIESTFLGPGIERSIDLPAGFYNPFIIGVKFQNVNKVWLNATGENAEGISVYGLSARAYDGKLLIRQNLISGGTITDNRIQVLLHSQTF